MSSGYGTTHESESRFSDVPNASERRLPPIQGFEKTPSVSLKEAIVPLKSLVPQIDQMLWTIEPNCTHPKDGLSSDESASIMLYTLEWTPQENSFYHILNANLRSEDRRKLIPWFSYLHLVIHALSKLPISSPRVIYRGIKLDLSQNYHKGKEFIWWSFSSCTMSMKVLESHVGQDGERTIFNILCRSAIDISRHSHFQSEQEVLLYPARQFKVRTSCNAGNGLRIIEIEETEPPFPLFQAFSSSPPVNPNLNILLLAHEGVGKSTFINAFVNYIEYQTFDEALSKKSVVLKPLSFAVTSNNYFETRTVQLGDIKSPKRPGCQTYIFDLQRNNGKKLCLIDTPSFQDSGSVHSTNSANTKHILDYVNNLTHLDAICLLLQPDESRLLNDLQSCFVQLLKRLGTQAYRNVIFCFTNALTTFYSPGKTASSIRNMFISYSLNNIKFDRSNTFFFENESFRYLIAIQNGIKFTHEDEQEYTTSWTESVMESKRLLDYISKQLVSCQIVKK